MNANGALLSAFGEGREERTPVAEICGMIPQVTAKKYCDRWSVTVRVGLELIKAVYKNADFKPGDVIRGNFYKCGDKTDVPHYGSYSPVGTPKPDFHRPEFFTEMILTEK